MNSSAIAPTHGITLESGQNSEGESKRGASVENLDNADAMDLVLIKFGKFENRLARITSLGAGGRHNMQILNDEGVICRRGDGAIINTALLREKFDVLGQDMEKAKFLLIKKRLELNLPATVDNIGCAVRTARAPASAQVGSPMNRSKTKTKGAGDLTGGGSEEDDDGESRNNLYWAEIAGDDGANAGSSDGKVVSRGVFCLWYGGSDIEREDTICVLPIAPAVVREHPGLPATNLVQDLAMAVDSAASTDQVAPPSGTCLPPAGAAAAQGTNVVIDLTTGALPSNGVQAEQAARAAQTPKDDGELARSLGVSPQLMVHVKRSALQPLDADLVRSKYSPAEQDNDTHAHFVIALVQFAEWDYPQRESYIWPDFMIPIMADPAVRELYLETARKHPLNTGARPLSDVLLFLLAAEHIGVLDEWYHTPFLSDRHCTDNIVALLQSLDEFRTSDEEVYRPFCRVGDSFEVDVSKHKFVCPRGKLVDLTAAGKEAAYVPPTASVDRYLGQVQLLREKFLRADQVIEAPVALDPFLTGLKTFYKDRVAPAGYIASPEPPLRRVQIMRDLDEYIAQSRRQNKRPTSLCTVKYVLPSQPGQSTVGGGPIAAAPALPVFSSPLTGSAGPPAMAPAVGSEPSGAQQHPIVDLSAMTSVIDLTSATSSSESGSNADHREKLDALPTSVGSSDMSNGAVTGSNLPRSMVVVNFGAQEVVVPLSYCRLFSLPEDTALEILHACSGDEQRALERVAEALNDNATATDQARRVISSSSSISSGSVSAAPGLAASAHDTIAKIDISTACNRLVVAPMQLDRFYSIVTKYVAFLLKIQSKFNRHLVRHANHAREATASSATKETTDGSGDGPYFFPSQLESPIVKKNEPREGKSEPVDGLMTPVSTAHGATTDKTAEDAPRLLSMQEVLLLYFLVFPALDEDEVFPNMTAFNSPLFRECSVQNATSAAAARTQERAAILSATKKSSGGRPPNESGKSSNQLGSSDKKSSKSSRRGERSLSPNKPNRWPANLPTIQHNLFWIIASSTPCICTGLAFRGKSGDSQAHLNVINISPEARRMFVTANQVQPFHDDLARLCTDERSAAFALALVGFAEWELGAHIPATSLLRKWYSYPEFITRMLVHTSSWLGWRKTVERNPRASTMTRRENYLFALQEDYERLTEEERNSRFELGSYPWDDTPLSEHEEDSDREETSGEREKNAATTSGYESFSDREVDGEEGGAQRRRYNPTRTAAPGTSSADEVETEDVRLEDALIDDGSGGKKRGRPRLDNLPGKVPRTKNGSTGDFFSFEDTASSAAGAAKPAHLRSLYNLFWISRSQLPCLYFDDPEKRFEDKFKVIPICCVTYHYPFMISGTNGIEMLKMSHLKLITDERTSEFTYALLDFAQQESERLRKAKLAEIAKESAVNGVYFEGASTEDGMEENSLMDTGIVQPNELFEWPQFIRDLVNQPKQWYTWRKSAERSGPGQKRHQYLRALQAEYKEIQEADLARQAAADLAAKQAAEDTARGSAGIKRDLTGDLQIHSYYNMFWLLRSNLPAIYYDTPEMRTSDKFDVLPINCCQYQYPTKITNSSVVIEPLSMVNLAHCTEDRTHDFTLALLDFAKWEQDHRRRLASQTSDSYFSESTTAASSGTSATEEVCELYDWPKFILKMLNAPEQWSTWRKKAERNSNREGKRAVYLRALIEDYRATFVKTEGESMDIAHG